MTRRDPTRLPISRVDRLWRGSRVVMAMGPITVPDRGAVIDAFVAIAAAGPHARIGLRFCPDSERHWIYRTDDLPDYARSCVVALPPGSDDDVDALMSRLADDYPDDRPARVFLADRHVLTMVNHALGDSRLSVSLPAAFVAYTQNGQLPDWCRPGVDPAPLRSAIRHTFATRPAIAAVLAERRATHAEGGVLAAPVHADGPTVPFRPRPVSISVTGPPGGTREMRVWTRHHRPGAAHFATVLTTVRQALVEQGVPCSPGVHMMFDLRRYLPRGARAAGNFVGGLDLPVPVEDPQTVTDVVARSAKVGRPLAAIAAATVLSGISRVPGYRPAPVTEVPARPQARLALSYIGPRGVEDSLPWAAPPDERMYWSRVDPAGPTAVTLLVAIVGKRLALSASFHASVFHPDRVRAALHAAHDDPIGLLQRAAGGDPARDDPATASGS